MRKKECGGQHFLSNTKMNNLPKSACVAMMNFAAHINQYSKNSYKPYPQKSRVATTACTKHSLPSTSPSLTESFPTSQTSVSSKIYSIA